MTSHRDVLQAVVGELQQRCPGCSLLLAGSLLKGTEHERSDIDLFGVFPDICKIELDSWRVIHSAPAVKVLESIVLGVAVTCTCIDRSLLDTMTGEPWRNRLFARAKTLCDPSGDVAQCQAAINDWFRLHLDIDAMWDQQEQDHARCKAAIRQGQNATMTFPSWDDFANHVDRIVRASRAT